MPDETPASAWKALVEGNERFVADRPEHPSQNVEHRASLTDGQHPIAVILGCSDSRVAAELLFDRGLGDLFVVRTAGNVIDSAVLGSVEFAVAVLGVPLVVVLGHDSCGAVKATVTALDEGEVPGGYIRDIVERVTPSILAARRDGSQSSDEFEARHVEETAAQLLERSSVISQRVERNEVAVVGVTYHLADGTVERRGYHGDIGEG